MRFSRISLILATAATTATATPTWEIRFDTLPKVGEDKLAPNWMGDATSFPSSNWSSQAQPVGNGRLGAMVFGNPLRERIQFNEITLWTGGENPSGGYKHEEFGSYQNFGDLHLEMDVPGEISGFSRSLDLETGIHATRWTQNGVAYTREVFASKPDQAIVVRVRRDDQQPVTVKASLIGAHDEKTDGMGGGIGFGGTLPNGMRYAAMLAADAVGGSCEVKDGVLAATGCSVSFFLTAGTDYVLDPAKEFRSGVDPAPLVRQQGTEAKTKGWETLKRHHLADFTAIMGRVSLDVGDAPAQASISQRLAAYKAGAEDPHLEALMFHFGRYLLISSSRGPLPANLQGLWNDRNRPAWFADYHTNINIQMNYWLSGPANLTECAQPLFDWTLAMIPGSKKAFRKEFGNNVPGWTMRTSVNTHGGNGWKWNLPASAWLAQHFWEQYAFTCDREFLEKTGWPVFCEISELWLHKLKEVDGKLVVPEGWSPEHGPREDGVAHDQQLIWDLFTNTLEAAAVLGREDDPLMGRIRVARGKLLMPQIGSWGQIMEWTTERPELEKSGHRHTSHLFGLHPGRQITKLSTPELFAAAAVSLEARGTSGDSRRSWTWPWRMALWGRLERPDKTGEMIRNLLVFNTFENLYTTHPPFQIDGNLGITAGVCETLLHSHAGEIHILPAPPIQWKSGSFRGLLARGGYEINAEWKDGSWLSARITSKEGGSPAVRVPGNPARIQVSLPDGERRILDANARGQFIVPMEKGVSMVLRPLAK